MIEQIDKTNFEVKMPCGDTVEIGDKRYHTTFEPHIKLNRWGDECFVGIGLPTIEKPLPIIEGDKIKWQGDKIDAHFYALEPRTVIAKDKWGNDFAFKQYELGGFDLEVILKEKPKSNKIIFDIETQGLRFSYQRPLTQAQIDEGAVRADNTNGCYAIYHATRTNMHRNQADAEKYKTGKMGNLYCPKIMDAEGKWVWGGLFIDEQQGKLIITIDQDFLDKATYPVSTGATNFGYETPGTAGDTGAGDLIFGGAYTTGGAGGTVTSISVYSNTGGSEDKWRGTLHKADNVLLDYTAEHTHTSNPGWETEDCTQSSSVLASTTYKIGFWMKSTTRVFWDEGFTGYYQSITYHATNVPPDPLVPNDYADHKFSIYCTYEEAVVAGHPTMKRWGGVPFMEPKGKGVW